VVDPEKAGSLLKQYRSVIFPEDRYDDVRYYRQAERIFENMKKIEMTGFVV